MVLQDVSRRTLSTGFGREENDARNAEHRNSRITTISIPHGRLHSYVSPNAAETLRPVKVRACTSCASGYALVQAHLAGEACDTWLLVSCKTAVKVRTKSCNSTKVMTTPESGHAFIARR